MQDASSKGVSLSDDEKKLFPLADDHWINQPVNIVNMINIENIVKTMITMRTTGSISQCVPTSLDVLVLTDMWTLIVQNDDDDFQVDTDGGLLLLQISVRQRNPTFTELLVRFMHHYDY